MAQMFTRSIKTLKATAKAAKRVGNDAVLETVGSVTYTAANDSEGAARKALHAAGIPTPRGTVVIVEVIGEKVFGMTVDEFMQYAHEVER